MSYKIDLHTHSIASPDGGLNLANYKQMLNSGGLDFIAITDHNTTDFALKARKLLGEQIIIGQEISTLQGEVIGLFLSSTIKPGQTLQKTIKDITQQNGLVYIPHPFEQIRSGVSQKDLSTIVPMIDIIETYNGRAYFNNKTKQAIVFAQTNNLVTAASSDAHGKQGWGKTYTIINRKPTKNNLIQCLQKANYSTKKVGMGILYPKLNKTKKLLGLVNV